MSASLNGSVSALMQEHWYQSSIHHWNNTWTKKTAHGRKMIATGCFLFCEKYGTITAAHQVWMPALLSAQHQPACRQFPRS